MVGLGVRTGQVDPEPVIPSLMSSIRLLLLIIRFTGGTIQEAWDPLVDKEAEVSVPPECTF